MADWTKLGIIAGGGDLPGRLVDAVRAIGKSVFVVRLAGIADAEFPGVETKDIGIAEAGRLLAALREAGCDAVSLVGIVKRPNFAALRPDFRGATLIPRLVKAASKGDDALLATLVGVFEDEGFQVVGADEVAADLVARPGAFGDHQPSEGHFRDLRIAAGVVEALGPFDVGQGAVVCRGLVLAVEAAEGTDAMLSRCAGLPADIRGTFGARCGVLAKLPKPDQERRVDLPTIGVETIERAAAAGLSGVFVMSGEALVIDRGATIAAANEHGLFIYGFTSDELIAPGDEEA